MNPGAGKIPIHAKTTVAELLDGYPALEKILLEQAPVFQKLKNPVLRKTIARLTTLEAAAQIAGINPRDLVMTLRRNAGLDEAVEAFPGGRTELPAASAEPPAWFRQEDITATLNAATLLEQGKAPLQEILSRLNESEPGAILKITLSFEPVPLIEYLQKQKIPFWLRPTPGGSYELLIKK